MNTAALRNAVKSRAPDSLVLLFQMIRYPEGIFRRPADLRAAARFLSRPTPAASLARRLALVRSLCRTTMAVDCAHTQEEMLSFIETVLGLPAGVEGCVVEAGCCKGGSTAKFSLAARLAGRRLFVFDSFEGLPDNEEAHGTTILGETPDFSRGRYAGTLEEVRRNVREHGAPEVCEFVKGWFDETMPGFGERVAAVYLDVDLVASTRTCLKHLYPLLSPGGYVYSQDGHLPLVIELLRDERFWEGEVGCARPRFEGLGERKLVWARKPAA
ncbi:MAG TPA: TylF/MycF/NovP-related O-methyltransferase [Pyrinomonadaceae bacterium]|nr:TylF/MycF/NovP-related O-methyltransferase [Pyrinomonadaceae bacterium]